MNDRTKPAWGIMKDEPFCLDKYASLVKHLKSAKKVRIEIFMDGPVCWANHVFDTKDIEMLRKTLRIGS